MTQKRHIQISTQIVVSAVAWIWLVKETKRLLLVSAPVNLLHFQSVRPLFVLQCWGRSLSTRRKNNEGDKPLPPGSLPRAQSYPAIRQRLAPNCHDLGAVNWDGTSEMRSLGINMGPSSLPPPRTSVLSPLVFVSGRRRTTTKIFNRDYNSRNSIPLTSKGWVRWKSSCCWELFLVERRTTISQDLLHHPRRNIAQLYSTRRAGLGTIREPYQPVNLCASPMHMMCKTAHCATQGGRG
jgi:hypothetical protein